jgi:hypothetical protein
MDFISVAKYLRSIEFRESNAPFAWQSPPHEIPLVDIVAPALTLVVSLWNA